MREEPVFSAFVTNLGKYNEGELAGEWVNFPTSNGEMQQVFRRIGLSPRYEEWFITDYDSSVPGLTDSLGEYESLSELNYLAHLVRDLGDLAKLEAVLDLGESTGSVKELINLTENLDCFEFLEGVRDDSGLGYYWAEDSGCYDTGRMGPLARYLDYEAFGRDIRLEEGGVYGAGGYVRYTGDSFGELYSGDLSHIPEEYRIKGPECARQHSSRPFFPER